MPLSRAKGRVAALLLAALFLGLVFGPTAFRALQALRHHGVDRALREISRFEPPWRGPWVAYERATPAEAGLDAARLEAWTRELAAHRTRHLPVVRGGKLVHEWTGPGRRVHERVALLVAK